MLQTFLEVPDGFEPTIRVLQTHALPLGYGTIFIIEKTPRVGLEPTTPRLTAECSTIELSRIDNKGGPTKWGDSLL